MDMNALDFPISQSPAGSTRTEVVAARQTFDWRRRAVANPRVRQSVSQTAAGSAVGFQLDPVRWAFARDCLIGDAPIWGRDKYTCICYLLPQRAMTTTTSMQLPNEQTM